MRTALAYKPEDDEGPVVSIEVELADLKTNFKEHRKEFTAAIARLDNDIRSAVSELRAEIRSMAAKAESDLKMFAARVEQQLREMRADHSSLRDKVDANYAALDAKIDRHYETLNAKIDKNHATLDAKIDTNNEKLTELSSKVNALFWLVGIAVAGATFFITVGTTFHPSPVDANMTSTS